MSPFVISMVVGVLLAAVFLFLTHKNKRPTWLKYLSVPGFFLGIIWVCLISSEMISTLKAIGVIMHLSDSLLGFTFVTVGDNIGDWVSNVTTARMGFPVMAMGATIAAPMMSLLISLGVSILILTLTGGGGGGGVDGSSGSAAAVIDFPMETSLTLFVSIIALIVILVAYIGLFSFNGHRVKREYGYGSLIFYGLVLTVLVCTDVLQVPFHLNIFS